MPEPGKNYLQRAAGRDGIVNTLAVAIGVSLVCSILVAGTAVFLEPVQRRNETAFRQRIILDVAGLKQPGVDVDAQFAAVEPRTVELASGRYVDSPAAESFDAARAAADPVLGMDIPADADIAGLKRRARFAPVYLVHRGGRLDEIILPVYGSGLWSTMYGYLAVAADGNTIRGLRFYEHAETPGLGDQVDDPDWLALWAGKKIRDDGGEPLIQVIRGAVQAGPASQFQVDGMSGATLTGRGVTRLIRYWTGPDGFGPFLDQLRNADGNDP